jgi:hypothetical protein
MIMNDFSFGPASRDEQIVFGPRKPDQNNVQEWMSFMKKQEIKRVCCLLSQHQIGFYNEDLIKHIARNSSRTMSVGRRLRTFILLILLHCRKRFFLSLQIQMRKKNGLSYTALVESGERGMFLLRGCLQA